MISTISIGLDRFDLSAAKARGIKVGYTAEVQAEAVAEHTVCLVLMTMLRVNEHIK